MCHCVAQLRLSARPAFSILKAVDLPFPSMQSTSLPQQLVPRVQPRKLLEI